MEMIPFNRPPYTGGEDQYVLKAMRSAKISGDGEFGRRCQAWFEESLRVAKTLLTPSCTHALEIAGLLLQIGPGDEVIMPSYTFVSTANAFALRGAKIVFVDVRPDTMNIDESQIEQAITSKTKALVVVHYAGVACAMDKIMSIANQYKLALVEDAAQGMMASYKGKPLGTFGSIGAFSFHETKNVTSGGEGGLLIISASPLVQRAEIIREKGTNRSMFFRGMVDKYSWVDVGSSYLPSELQAAYLWGQLERCEEITRSRLLAWSYYYDHLTDLQRSGRLELPVIPEDCTHNAHMFYIKARDLAERTALLEHLTRRGVHAVFHYVPLHSSPAGREFGEFRGADRYTTSESERLLRLPLWYGITERELNVVVNAVREFYAAA